MKAKEFRRRMHEMHADIDTIRRSAPSAAAAKAIEGIETAIRDIEYTLALRKKTNGARTGNPD